MGHLPEGRWPHQIEEGDERVTHRLPQQPHRVLEGVQPPAESLQKAFCLLLSGGCPHAQGPHDKPQNHLQPLHRERPGGEQDLPEGLGKGAQGLQPRRCPEAAHCRLLAHRPPINTGGQEDGYPLALRHLISSSSNEPRGHLLHVGQHGVHQHWLPTAPLVSPEGLEGGRGPGGGGGRGGLYKGVQPKYEKHMYHK